MGINYKSVAGRNTAFCKEQPTVGKLHRLLHNGWSYIKCGHGKYLRFTVNMETGEVIRIERKTNISNFKAGGKTWNSFQDINWQELQHGEDVC